MAVTFACPDERKFAQFAAGELLGEEAMQFATHLEGCASCVARMEAVPLESLLLNALGSTPAESVNDDELGELMSRLEKLVDDSAQATLDGGANGSEPLGNILDRYELREPIARGGMGEVIRAWDKEIGREVAVKVVRGERSNNRAVSGRFHEEAKITGQLQHPGIPPVHDLGTLPDGRPFMAMKLIRGRTFMELLRERPSPRHDLSRYLQIFETLCQTVAYAHAQQVIHRDLKPHNVMVGAFAEVQVMDWGLAKRLAGDQGPVPGTTETASGEAPPDHMAPDVTAAGTIMGTPAYMAPEQACGDIAKMGRHSDVFSLGAILCEILTGGPAYRGRDLAEIVLLARHGRLQDAQDRLDSCGADTELIELAKRCLRLDPADRPTDGSAVARDIGAYKAGVAERLKQAELERAAAAAKADEERRRRRAQSALAGSSVALLLALGVGGWWIQSERTARAADELRVSNERELAGAKNRLATELALTQAEDALRRQRVGEADVAIGQADKRLAADSPDDLRRRLQKAQKDRHMIFELNITRGRHWCEIDGDTGSRAAKSQYPSIFATYNVTLADSDPAVVADLVRQSIIKDRLIDGLYDWFATLEPSAELRKLAAILNALDPSPPHCRIRDAIATDKIDVLQREVDAADPNVFPISLAIVLSRIENLHADSAERLLRFAWYREPNNPSLLFRLSGLQSPGDIRKDRRGDLGYIRALLALLPESTYAWTEMGTANKARGNLQAALECYQKALQFDPKYPLAYYNLGNCLLAKKDADGALAAYRKSIELGESTGRAYCNLGALLHSTGKNKDADEAFRKAIEVNPNRVEAWTNLGKLLIDRKDFDGAMKAYRQAIAVKPDSANAWASVSYLLSQGKKNDEAIDAARKAIAADPSYGQGHFELGRALAAKSDWNGSVAAYRAAIKCQPRDFWSHFSLGIALVPLNDKKGAAEAFRQATLIDPTNLGAQMNLGNLLAQIGDRKGASAAYRAALAANGKYFFAHFELGKLLQANGDLDGAIAALSHAVECNAKSADARLQLGSAYKAKGEFETAQRIYGEALQLYPAGSPGRRGAAESQMHCEYLRGLVKILPEVLAGKRAPANEKEAATLLGICYGQKRFAAVAKVFQIVLARYPKIADDPASSHRYNAACAALLAAAGQGTDADKASNDEKRGWREQALGWLKSDLDAWRDSFETNPETQAPRMVQVMRHWRSDPDLEAIRQPDALKALRATERSAWQQLWQDVEALERRANGIKNRQPSK